jgi:hypothetical protein
MIACCKKTEIQVSVLLNDMNVDATLLIFMTWYRIVNIFNIERFTIILPIAAKEGMWAGY